MSMKDFPSRFPAEREKRWKKHVAFWGKVAGTVLFGLGGTIAAGIGMHLTVIWNMPLQGIPVFLIGLCLTLCLIPLLTVRD